jgi:hypothetical protein
MTVTATASSSSGAAAFFDLDKTIMWGQGKSDTPIGAGLSSERDEATKPRVAEVAVRLTRATVPPLIPARGSLIQRLKSATRCYSRR